MTHRKGSKTNLSVWTIHLTVSLSHRDIPRTHPVHTFLGSPMGQVYNHNYRRLWLISACAYERKWQANMRLIEDMR